MSGDRDQMWSPDNTSRVGDEADDQPRVIANRLHAVQVQMHEGFDRLGRALEGLTRIDAKLDVIIDRQNYTDRRVDALEQRIAALESNPAIPVARVVRPRKKR